MDTLRYSNQVLSLLDQTKLPHEIIYIECKTFQDVYYGIKNMIVRGAPAIGVSAAFGVALGALSIKTQIKDDFFNELNSICQTIKSARPTAVNLEWAIDQMYNKAIEIKDTSIVNIQKMLESKAIEMFEEDIKINKLISQNGNSLIKNNSKILTHCNAGSLATCKYGTAIGVILFAHQSNKNITVYVDETRPYLQGARLTSFELKNENIPFYLICDNMAGYFMKKGEIDCVIVGADRIAKNGDTANKIGTYSLSVLAKAHNIPFYVAAPSSTIDFNILTGDEIIIEERPKEELTHINGFNIAPNDIRVKNPSFDITPSSNITSIITEKQVFSKVDGYFNLL